MGAGKGSASQGKRRRAPTLAHADSKRCRPTDADQEDRPEADHRDATAVTTDTIAVGSSSVSGSSGVALRRTPSTGVIELRGLPERRSVLAGPGRQARELMQAVQELAWLLGPYLALGGHLIVRSDSRMMQRAARLISGSA